MNESYSLRPYRNDDIPFIQSSWGSSYYQGGGYQRLMSPQLFHHYHRPIRESFFDRPCSSVSIICATEDPSLIMAWLAWEKPEDEDCVILHFLYVKQAFKGEGLAKELLSSFKDQKPILYTHLTEQAEKIIEKKRLKYFYCPHLT